MRSAKKIRYEDEGIDITLEQFIKEFNLNKAELKKFNFENVEIYILKQIIV